MREIIFRGKRVYNGEWVYGLLARTSTDVSNIVEKKFDVLTPVYTNTVGQYTGLTDKNGTKIFEGDIVKFIAGKENGIFDIKYGNSEFYADWIIQNNFMDITTSMKYLQCSSELEVIGNIFDNPELMEVLK